MKDKTEIGIIKGKVSGIAHCLSVEERLLKTECTTGLIRILMDCHGGEMFFDDRVLVAVSVSGTSILDDSFVNSRVERVYLDGSNVRVDTEDLSGILINHFSAKECKDIIDACIFYAENEDEEEEVTI